MSTPAKKTNKISIRIIHLANFRRDSTLFQGALSPIKLIPVEKKLIKKPINTVITKTR